MFYLDLLLVSSSMWQCVALRKPKAVMIPDCTLIHRFPFYTSGA